MDIQITLGYKTKNIIDCITAIGEEVKALNEMGVAVSPLVNVSSADRFNNSTIVVDIYIKKDAGLHPLEIAKRLRTNDSYKCEIWDWELYNYGREE